MAYKGRYIPKKPSKYRGDAQNIIYRSLWERKFMVYCDTSPSIIEWGSEEVIIPYLSPLDGRIHRYFPDFYIKVKQADGLMKKMIIEVKPKVQCSPPKTPKRKPVDLSMRCEHGVSMRQNGSMQMNGVRIMV